MHPGVVRPVAPPRRGQACSAGLRMRCGARRSDHGRAPARRRADRRCRGMWRAPAPRATDGQPPHVPAPTAGCWPERAALPAVPAPEDRLAPLRCRRGRAPRSGRSGRGVRRCAPAALWRAAPPAVRHRHGGRSAAWRTGPYSVARGPAQAAAQEPRRHHSAGPPAGATRGAPGAAAPGKPPASPSRPGRAGLPTGWGSCWPSDPTRPRCVILAISRPRAAAPGRVPPSQRTAAGHSAPRSASRAIRAAGRRRRPARRAGSAGRAHRRCRGTDR